MVVLSELDLVRECYILTSGDAEVLMHDGVGGGVEHAGRLGRGSVLGGEALLCGQLQPRTVWISPTSHALKMAREEMDCIASKLSSADPTSRVC